MLPLPPDLARLVLGAVGRVPFLLRGRVRERCWGGRGGERTVGGEGEGEGWADRGRKEEGGAGGGGVGVREGGESTGERGEGRGRERRAQGEQPPEGEQSGHRTGTGCWVGWGTSRSLGAAM